MPDPIPQSQKGQLDAFFGALGVPVGDFTAAMNAINAFQAAANWQNEQKAIFTALGATDQAGALTAITSLKTPPAPVAADNADRDAMFSLLGVTDQAGALNAIGNFKTTGLHYAGLLAILEVQDQAGAIVRIGSMSVADKNHAALVTALGATDHPTALTAATNLEATVDKRVKERAAAAGLPEPAPKGKTPAGEEKGTERTQTARSKLAANINAQLDR